MDNKISKIKLVPVTEPELRKFTYTCDEGKASCFGHMRADFGHGNEFWSSWWPHNEDLRPEIFEPEYTDAINQLRETVFKDRSAARQFNSEHPEAGEDGAMSTDKHFYCTVLSSTVLFIRLEPVRGNYDVYVYCYNRKLFEGGKE